MAVYQRGETYYHWITIRDRNNVAYDPDSVKITISNPCGEVVINAQNMTKNATGVYYYAYDIPSDGSYGEWDVKVVAVASGDDSIFKDKFYLLPWDVVDQIRKMTGMSSVKTVSDDDIALIIWEAYQDALDSVYVLHSNEASNCNPDTGAWFDGSNTTFSTKFSPIADSNGDGSVTGWGQQSCGTDIDGWWKDDNGDCYRVKVTVNEPRCGNIDITQLDGSPIPSTCYWVRLNYRVEYHSYDERLFRQAVVYLAADKCVIRFWELHRATLADLDSNKEEIISYPKRFKKEYLKILKKLKNAPVGMDRNPGSWKKL